MEFDSQDENERVVEALLFANAEPLTLQDLAAYIPDRTTLRHTLLRLETQYRMRGINLKEINGAYAFRTAVDLSARLRLFAVRERKLSRAAIETLAIIAYHQPTTRAEIEEIRGVAVSRGTLDLLLELDWIKLGKRRDTPGRPVTFLTTPVFLDHFDLTSTQDLPGIKELRESGLLDRNPLAEQKLSENENDLNEEIDDLPL